MQPTLEINSLADLLTALPDTQIKLKSDVERYIRLVSFKQGKIELRVTDPRHMSLIGQIVQALLDLTGDLWVVSPSEEDGEPTLAEQRREAKKARDEKERAHPAFTHPLLSSAKLLGIYDREHNIIQGNFEKD